MINTDHLSTPLTDRLRKDILREKIPAGSKLVEREICEEYGVSRTPVREALHDLKNEDLVELIPNKGAYITGFTISDMRDIFKLRGILEAQCVRWAIERITHDELETLEKKYECLELYTRRADMRKLRSLDIEFHGLIYEASQNLFLMETLHRFLTYIRYSALVKVRRRENIDEIFAEHSAVFDAFISRNPDDGAEAMRVHIHNAALRANLYLG